MTDPTHPNIAPLGVDGVLVRFSDKLTEPANRAALAFRAATERAGWDGVLETSTALASAYIRFDPLATTGPEIRAKAQGLLTEQDWYAAPMPEGRRRWIVPAAFGGTEGPQFDEAIAMAGLSADDAIAQITETELRVLTIGFAPGQPYLGELPPAWDLPRQQTLTPRVPIGALTVAIRQFVLFAVDAPTGWRHIAQTGFEGYRADRDQPFALRPGDAFRIRAVSAEELRNIRAADTEGLGGATCEPLR